MNYSRSIQSHIAKLYCNVKPKTVQVSTQQIQIAEASPNNWDYTNRSLRAATNVMRNSNNPCRNREIFVEP